VASKALLNELGPGDELYEPLPGDVFITVGTISRVGREHIEYEVNTVPGFSGAPVIVLDPDSDCHMKVIAAHAGLLRGPWRELQLFGCRKGRTVRNQKMWSVLRWLLHSLECSSPKIREFNLK